MTPELLEVTSAGAPTARWQDSFDAVLDDVFRVQAEIATRVAGALKLTLGAQEERRLSGQPTANIAAYEAYMRGKELLDAADAPTLQRAVALAGTGRLAGSVLRPGLGASVGRAIPPLHQRHSHAVDLPRRPARPRRAAIQLAPGLPDGRLAMNAYFRNIANDPSSAFEESRKGLAIDGNNAELLRGAALAKMSLGRWEESLAHLEQAAIDRSPGSRHRPRSAAGSSSSCGVTPGARSLRRGRGARPEEHSAGPGKNDGLAGPGRSRRGARLARPAEGGDPGGRSPGPNGGLLGSHVDVRGSPERGPS